MNRSVIAARRRSGAADERGSLTIEMVFLFPMMLFILFIGVQAATWYHARSIVLAAAQDGARTAAAEGGTAAAGRSAASNFVTGSGGFIMNPVINVTRTSEMVTVRVSGRTQGLLPGFDPSVSQEARRPVERLTRPECITSEAGGAC